MEYCSPLRYPGGKGKLSNFIERIFEINGLSGGQYCEPYAGGGSIAISLLFNEYASSVVINDLDKSIFSFWHSVLNETDRFCKRIRDTKVDLVTWRKQKEVQKDKSNQEHLDLGFSTFFLNRTNRSGILNAGVIGGLSQNGRYKVDARYNKDGLIHRIEKIANYKNRIRLFNLDGCALVKKLKSSFKEKTLLYLDPPYYVKGKDLYYSYFNHQDHEKVKALVSSLSKTSWLVSYDNVPEIRKIFRGTKKLEYNLDYCAIQPKAGKEIMFFSDNLKIPKLSFN